MRELDLTNSEVRDRLATIQRSVAELAVKEAELEYRVTFQNAPVDDEEETDEERAAIAERETTFAQGKRGRGPMFERN